MKPIGILYATREGQTERIADHVGAVLRARGLAVEIKNLRLRASDIRLDQYSAVILAASVHVGKHEPEMIRFVKQNVRELGRLPAAFLSVSLSQAGVELASATPEQRAASIGSVQQVLERFFRDTGWHPKIVKPVAGALLYTRYNFLVRFIMKRIAGKSGGSTDTSRDREYTDWAELDCFTGTLAEEFAISIG
jgi:menaquinone-dependent protoporphyrinogen oxidase